MGLWRCKEQHYFVTGNFDILLWSPQSEWSNTTHMCNLLLGNTRKLKNWFKKSNDKALAWKRSFNCLESAEKVLFVYLWLYRLVLCFVTLTVFLAMPSYEVRSVNASNWYGYKALTTGRDVVFAFDRCERERRNRGLPVAALASIQITNKPGKTPLWFLLNRSEVFMVVKVCKLVLTNTRWRESTAQ